MVKSKQCLYRIQNITKNLNCFGDYCEHIAEVPDINDVLYNMVYDCFFKAVYLEQLKNDSSYLVNNCTYNKFFCKMHSSITVWNQSIINHYKMEYVDQMVLGERTDSWFMFNDRILAFQYKSFQKQCGFYVFKTKHGIPSLKSKLHVLSDKNKGKWDQINLISVNEFNKMKYKNELNQTLISQYKTFCNFFSVTIHVLISMIQSNFW
jgi:hypothetical protein